MAENDTMIANGQKVHRKSASMRRAPGGQVPRSRDLGAAAVVLTGGLGLLRAGRAVFGARLLAMMRDGLTLGHARDRRRHG